jgi:hypothetical protein
MIDDDLFSLPDHIPPEDVPMEVVLRVCGQRAVVFSNEEQARETLQRARAEGRIGQDEGHVVGRVRRIH